MSAPPGPPAVALLVVDLGGVACRFLPDRRLAALADLTGLPPGTVDQLVFGSGLDDAAERGRCTLEQLVDDLGAVLGLAEGPDRTAALRGAWSTAFEPDRRVLDLVARVRARGDAGTAVFTNNGPLLEAALGHELATVGEAVDRVVCSWRLGATKPDPAAFARATEVLGVPPDAILFVDDSEANVAAADAAGWRTHHHRDPLNLQAALTAAGLL